MEVLMARQALVAKVEHLIPETMPLLQNPELLLLDLIRNNLLLSKQLVTRGKIGLELLVK